MPQKVSPTKLARIVYLMSCGCTQEMVAERLGLSSRTIRTWLKMVKDGKVEVQK